MAPNNGLLAYNDDVGFPILLSKLTFALVQGQTYNIVVSSYDTQEVGNFTITSTTSGFTNPFNWYTVASGGNSIFTGNTFNPVGVTGSGIPNTATPLIKNYFVAAASNPSCRTTTTFTVESAAISAEPTGFVTASDTVCAIFNGGTLTLNAYSGTIVGWESSEDNFATSTYFASASPTFSYAGLLKTTKFRAVIDRGSCNVAASKETTIFVTSPVQILTNTAIADTTLNRASLTISSNQKLDNQSKISYEAGRNIELNTGFEATNGSVFSAEIFMNDCYIPVQLTLQPNAANGKDTDISSLFVNNSYGSSKYIVPSAWTQFGNQEIRRTLIEFDLSSIPANAVIDSAFLSLSFSDTFIQENPPFTGHFGDNILEIKRIEQPWAAATATWTNQPTVSENNKVVVTAAASQTANYTKLNVKNLINDQLSNGNNGLMIRHQTESPFRITCLASSEDTTESKRPKLVIYYRYL
ncbi:MAG: DNRLRE domain-containing protein [Spirosomaceae bacterium]|nr:DNRLRE domain-containing protein [Spirosomataceae bacterium]